MRKRRHHGCVSLTFTAGLKCPNVPLSPVLAEFLSFTIIRFTLVSYKYNDTLWKCCFQQVLHRVTSLRQTHSQQSGGLGPNPGGLDCQTLWPAALHPATTVVLFGNDYFSDFSFEKVLQCSKCLFVFDDRLDWPPAPPPQLGETWPLEQVHMLGLEQKPSPHEFLQMAGKKRGRGEKKTVS